MSILNKRVSELTDKDWKDIKKPLGVKGRPYPMRNAEFVEDDKGRKTLMRYIGVLEQATKPLMVYSERSYGEVMGMALRDMPTPSMLPLFKEALSARKPGNKCVIQYYKGAPGAGKTFMSEMNARMRDPRGAIKIDCGKKNLAELLFETVLDFGKDRRFYDEFDRRIQAYNEAKTDEQRARILHPHSVAILRAHLGEAFSEEKGKLAIDWNATHQCIRDNDGKDFLNSRETIKTVSEGLMSVAKKEGFGDLAGNALGMATQKGPLIRAWEEGREIVLDEFNRRKEGTTASLHTVLQFLAGEIDQVTVENTLKEKGDDVGQTFTFRRADQKAGFFVSMTGNSEEDGSDVDELPQSVSSRVPPRFIPVATVEDWQHRICQMLTGLPVSTLYRAGEDQWRKNPDAFRHKLAEWRTLGLSKDEAANVSPLQMKLLRRWEDVLEASDKLARFYYAWSQVVNPESQVHRTGSLTQLMEEIDERYNAEVSIDFRKITRHIQKAMDEQLEVIQTGRSEGFDLGDWNEPPKFDESEIEEDTALHFGTRLVQVILEYINETTEEVGKRNLYRQLMQHAADCGLCPPLLQEGKPSNRRSVASLLDDNPYVSDVPDIKAELVRDLLCDYLREADPKISNDNNDIMSVRTVREVMEALEEDELGPVADVGEEPEDNIEAEDDAPRSMTVFNDDLDTLQSRPLTQAVTIDSIPESAEAPAAETPDADELLSRVAFLYSLAAPSLRKGNLTAAWNRALSRSGIAEPAQDAANKVAVGDSLAMAENRSESGLAVTTLMVGNDNKGKAAATPLHLVWNKAQDRLLVVGEGKLPARVNLAFANSRVQYIDKSEDGAARKANAALYDLVGKDDKLKDRLKTAFLMRNMLDSLPEQEKADLGELLVRRDVKCYLPHYVAKPAMRAA